jgi:hypothetical protein
MQFVDADDVIEKNTVVVLSSKVKNPAAVRFAFTDTDSSNLYNKAWLPSTSIRTDTTKFCIMNVLRDLQFEKEKSQFNLSLYTKDGNAEIVYTLDEVNRIYSHQSLRMQLLFQKHLRFSQKRLEMEFFPCRNEICICKAFSKFLQSQLQISIFGNIYRGE